jgi:hypothetical protein
LIGKQVWLVLIARHGQGRRQAAGSDFRRNHVEYV